MLNNYPGYFPDTQKVKETFSREDALVKIDEFDKENLKIAVLNIFKDSGEVFHLKFHYKTRPKDTRFFVKVAILQSFSN